MDVIGLIIHCKNVIEKDVLKIKLASTVFSSIYMCFLICINIYIIWKYVEKLLSWRNEPCNIKILDYRQDKYWNMIGY